MRCHGLGPWADPWVGPMERVHLPGIVLETTPWSNDPSVRPQTAFFGVKTWVHIARIEEEGRRERKGGREKEDREKENTRKREIELVCTVLL